MSGVLFSLDRAAAAMNGRVLKRGPERFEGVSIDSRNISKEQAFFAIIGDRFDGHGFVDKAAEAGAALLVISEVPAGGLPDGGGAAVVQVDDTKLALAALARAWRDEVDPAVLAITGSVGKTTTKELCRNILARRGPTHATPGNFNNDIGLPLTLLAMPPDTAYLVAEMGMNAKGEIATLARIARPDVGLITCIAPAHLAGLGSIEGVAAAKAELIEGLPPDAVAVVPLDEPLLKPWTDRLSTERLRTFGDVTPGATVRLQEHESLGADGSQITLGTDGGELKVMLPLPGRHNGTNAAAAAAATLAMGATLEEIGEGLATVPELGHRSRLVQAGERRLLDDCYNANPTSVKAALNTIEELAFNDPAAAVLGAMLELGPDEAALHREVGAHAAQCRLKLLVTVGPLGRHIAEGAEDAKASPDMIRAVETVEQAAEAVRKHSPDNAWVLVKASRGARLERVLEILQEHNQNDADPSADRLPQGQINAIVHSTKMGDNTKRSTG